MNQLAAIAPSSRLHALIGTAGERTSIRFLEFFVDIIRNAHTRRAYDRAVADFLAWCEDTGVPSIAAVQPLHVATWVEVQTRECAAPREISREIRVRVRRPTGSSH